MNSPVKAIHTIIALNAYALNHNIIAIFTIIISIVTLAIHNVMTNNWAVKEQLRILTSHVIKAFATLHPVVALTSHHEIRSRTATHKVVILTGKHFSAINDGKHRVLTRTAKINVKASTIDDHVISIFTTEKIITEGINNNVIAVAAKDLIRLHAGIEIVITAIAP